MRRLLPFLLTLLALVRFAALAPAADPPVLSLSDPTLPLVELRPLDRRVYLLSLEGDWRQPALAGVPYYVNMFFPDGGSDSHLVMDDIAVTPNGQGGWTAIRATSPFRQGEVRAVIQDHQLRRHGVAKGGTIRVALSAHRPASSPNAANVVSTVLALSWPMDRPLVQKPPRTKFSPPDLIDAFPPNPNELSPRAPTPIPAPKPDKEAVPPPKPEKDPGA